ncbi:unnamed protein product [Umbelopsis ramanniana]
MVTYSVNLKHDSLTNTMAETTALFNAFPRGKQGFVKLELLEIGNESDFYFHSVDAYAAQWSKFAQRISKIDHYAAGEGPAFQIGDFGKHVKRNFSIINLLKTGVLSGALAAKTNTVAQHMYLGSGANGTVNILLDKSISRGKLGALRADIEAANSKGMNYFLGETNSFYGGGAGNASNSGATAIWATDYLLQAATLNISRTYYHNYIYAEAIGSSGKSRIAELPVRSTHISSYGIWEDKKLVRIVVINSHPWVYASKGTRPVIIVQLQGLTKGTTATYKSLHVPYADVAEGVTWAGQNYATKSGLPSGKVVQTTLKNVKLDISATSVVLIFLPNK